MNFHPIANIFPLLTGDDYAKFKQDILDHGLVEPILLHPDGSILDGRNRFMACRELGIEPPTELYKGDLSIQAIFNLVMSLNVHRRHLDSSQRAAVAVEILPMLEEEAKERQRLAGGDKKSEEYQKSLSQKVEQPISTNGKSTYQAATILNTNHQYVSSAKKLSIANPSLLAKVKSGEKNIKSAMRQLKREERANNPQLISDEPTTLTLYHADMLTLLPSLGLFDLVVTDPPYNVTDWTWDKIGPEFFQVTHQWLEVIQAHLKPKYNLFWFCSPQFSTDIEIILRKLSFPIQSRIVWHRRNMAKGSHARHKFIDTWEMIFHCGNRPLNFPQDWDDSWFDVQTIAVPQTNFDNDPKYHPTQKPEQLIKRLVEFGSYPGDSILDPFAGSGTTGAVTTGRQCTLIEQQEEYIEVIERRCRVSRESK